MSLPRPHRLRLEEPVTDIFLISLHLGVLFATSTHPLAARVAGTCVLVGMPAVFGNQVVKAALAPPFSAVSLAKGLSMLVWWTGLCWLWWFFFSPRPVPGHPCNCPTCVKAVQSAKTSSDAARNGILGALVEGGAYESRGPLQVAKLCWVGRMLHHQMDDGLNLRILTLLFWIGAPVLILVIGISLLPAVSLKVDSGEVEVISPELVALDIMSLFMLAAATSLAIQVARVAVAQRDELIHDLGEWTRPPGCGLHRRRGDGDTERRCGMPELSALPR